MANAFAEGLDFHQENADSWGMSRFEAKTFLYALLYGASDKKLGKGDSEVGAAMRAKVYGAMPALEEFMEDTLGECRRKLYITTLYGRRIHYPDINSRDFKLKSHAERQCFNAKIQGSAGEVFKEIQLRLFSEFRGVDWLKFVIPVHDELVLYCKEDMVGVFVPRLEEVFSSSATRMTHCPIAAEAKVGNNWKEVH